MILLLLLFLGEGANEIVNFKPFTCLDIVDIVVVGCCCCCCFWGAGRGSANKIVNFKLFTCLDIVDIVFFGGEGVNKFQYKLTVAGVEKVGEGVCGTWVKRARL